MRQRPASAARDSTTPAAHTRRQRLHQQPRTPRRLQLTSCVSALHRRPGTPPRLQLTPGVSACISSPGLHDTCSSHHASAPAGTPGSGPARFSVLCAGSLQLAGMAGSWQPPETCTRCRGAWPTEVMSASEIVPWSVHQVHQLQHHTCAELPSAAQNLASRCKWAPGTCHVQDHDHGRLRAAPLLSPAVCVAPMAAGGPSHRSLAIHPCVTQ